MNFNYSYRAFLISSLLVGNLVLLLVSVKLNKKELAVEKEIPIEYEELLPIEEEELALALEVERMKIETNKAYNEAEEFIEELENEREESLEEENLDGNEDSFETGRNKIDLSKAENKLKEVKKKLATSSKKKPKPSNGVSRKTTISYSLVNRKAMYLPNPVYTCDAAGKVVITVEVNELGKITRKEYNATLSTTTNGCLIDAALAYAAETRFSTDASKDRQLGTISYHFPGQQ
ncbi:hypothetical protein KXJ69_02775 [Aureisphaera sp. CAU 1614]|uniref:TonB C-terminal domain-containing protein n=1 Tax=Halomarinibacterium sedimenti TaxID=2857106 RepID=A0A9X1FM38_9FLAO|nr:hypothetical protein [Halomarinibacterium sedimenti]MBW2937011.1 hypothetical protein [Halomarinibacterium sedimenti]